MLLGEGRIFLSDRCVLDLCRGDVIKDGLRLALSKRELQLISRLVQCLGRPVSTSELLNYIWGHEVKTPVSALYQCVHRVRSRLEDDVHHPKLLVPIKGYGYMLRRIHEATRLQSKDDEVM